MKKIKLDQFGFCKDKDCPYRKECAQHETAGEFRSEDGFRPEIFKKSNDFTVYVCKTASESHSLIPSYGADFPNNVNELGNGFIPISEIPIEFIKKGAVTNPEVEFFANEFDKIPSNDIIVENGSYESLQEFIISIGGRFYRKNELENMSVKNLIEMISPNVKEQKKIIFIVDK
jgi:hypothetical protein